MTGTHGSRIAQLRSGIIPAQTTFLERNLKSQKGCDIYYIYPHSSDGVKAPVVVILDLKV